MVLDCANLNNPPTGEISISGDPVQGSILTPQIVTALDDEDGLGSPVFNGWQMAGVGATSYTFELTQMKSEKR